MDAQIRVVVNSNAESHDLNAIRFESAYGLRLNGNSVDDAYLKLRELADQVVDENYNKDGFYLNCVPTITSGLQNQLDVTQLDKLSVETTNREPVAVNMDKQNLFYVGLRAPNSQALRIYDLILFFVRCNYYSDSDSYGYIIVAFNYDDAKKHPVLKVSANPFINRIYKLWSKFFPKKMTDESLDKELPNKMLSIIDFSLIRPGTERQYLDIAFNSRYLVIPGKCEDENANDTNS